MSVASERTPLLLVGSSTTSTTTSSWRHVVHDFLQAKTPAGRSYQTFMIGLILLNVLAFSVSTLFLPPYASTSDSFQCGDLCDALWFGNVETNDLQWLQLGATSVLELVTIAVFTLDYVAGWMVSRVDGYVGLAGKLRYMMTFFSIVDLISIVPFYVDALVLRHRNLTASSWVRVLRLLKLASLRFNTAWMLIVQVFQQQKAILQTAMFVGITTWMVVSALYYVAERRNHQMIYCPTCPDVQVDLCHMDEWGKVTCPDCVSDNDDNSDDDACYNLYESIPMASYYALLNLFGEFPLIAQHSVAGQVVGTITAVVAVAVFALPASIIGNGMESVIAQQRAHENNINTAEDEDQDIVTPQFYATDSTVRGRMYNFWHAQTTPLARGMDVGISLLIVGTVGTFVADTFHLTPRGDFALEVLELLAVIIFTVEYSLRVYSIVEDPKYISSGRWNYVVQFLPVVDLLSFAPFWLHSLATRQLISFRANDSVSSNIVKSLRLLRILRFEKYTHAFRSFDNVIARNLDVLTLTAATALMIWVFFSIFLYFTERDNPDLEMAGNYNSVPNAMWLTLLNLSGESPLCQYSKAGKVLTGILGLFATGVFGIPIGVLGAGFEELVQKENADNAEELAAVARESRGLVSEELGTSMERHAYNFVNGVGSMAARTFEAMIYVLIFLVVAVGIWQTVDGHENDFHHLEWFGVVVFTFEYVVRLVGAGADPEFAKGRNAWSCRLRYLVSFYSIVDLLAIVPFYVALALPNSIVDQYDEYLRMFRILRLVKLDKYVPSITLLDDVIRLKFSSLRVAFYAAMTLWILFAALIFVCEHDDTINDIDPVPLYGCDSDCTMKDRFQNYFDSMVYTGIHLTGDYPIITYTWPARFVNFFMVIAAVGVVSIPSGLIASGFVEIVQSKNKAKRRRGETPVGRAGDDWYEHSYRELDGVDPPNSRFGPRIDAWQISVNEFLNGKQGPDGHTQWTTFSYASRVFMFTVIVSNVLAVILESIPRIDRAVGNQTGNLFDVFEAFSVMVFALEYILRLFCARKNREALYSPLIYATTFFGIVDFMSTAPWFVEQALIATGNLDAAGDNAKIFRIFRIFRILQLEDFVVAFSKLDNVFRASKDVLKATGLMAIIIWVGCGALFYIFEENNPNWRSCDPSVPDRSSSDGIMGCYDFKSTAACNEVYPGMCTQTAFTNMPNAMFYTAVFLGGEWGVVDFTWPGRLVCLFLCVAGIALYAIPIGTLFDSFGAVLGLVEEDDEEDDEDE